jgi:hypothetical protein
MGQLVGATALGALELEPARDLLPSVGSDLVLPSSGLVLPSSDLVLPNGQGGPAANSIAPEAKADDPSDLTLISIRNKPPAFAAAAVADAPAMAPGLGGFNIEPPAPRPNPTEASVSRREPAPELAATTTDVSAWSPPAADLPRIINLGIGPQGRIPAPGLPAPGFEPNTLGIWMARGSLILNVLTLLGVVGLHLLPSLETAPQADAQSHARTAAQPASLVVMTQRGSENEPLPIGVSLRNASGGETVIIAGLESGTELSLGSSFGPTAWLISAADLEQTFIAAPPNFLGVMSVAAHLRSSGGELLDSKIVRYEWAKNKLREGGMTPAPDLSERDRAAVPLAAETLALLLKRAEILLQQGEVSAARLLLRRAAPHSAQAALELAMTFDQVLLTQWGVVGVEPDEAEARRWYELATNLGSAEAASHRRRLAGDATDGDPSEAKHRAQP